MRDSNASTSVIICTHARTGSGLLCELLWNSGVVGRPEEWFGEGVVARCGQEWGTDGGRAYVERVLKEGTTPNGVFGMKLHWTHWDRLLGMIGEFPAPLRDGRPDRLAGVFPGIRYVWLRRRDKVRQAVSRFRQRQTGITKTGDVRRRSGSLDYDFKAIDALVRDATDRDQDWRDYFERFGAPIEVVYEDDLERGQADVLKRLSAELGLTIRMPDAAARSRQKLSDDLSEELVRLYRLEAGLT